MPETRSLLHDLIALFRKKEFQFPVSPHNLSVHVFRDLFRVSGCGHAQLLGLPPFLSDLE